MRSPCPHARRSSSPSHRLRVRPAAADHGVRAYRSQRRREQPDDGRWLPGAAGLAGADDRHVPIRSVQLESLGILARGRSHPGQRVSGSRLRNVGRFQRQRRQDQGSNGRLTRPRSILRQSSDDRAAFSGERGSNVRVSGDRRGGQRLRRRGVVPAERDELHDLRLPFDRRRAHVRPFVPITTATPRAGRSIPEQALPGRNHRELRRQPDLRRAPLPHV